MGSITTFDQLKQKLQNAFDENEDSLVEEGSTSAKLLKAYLIESNVLIDDIDCPLGRWARLNGSDWFINRDDKNPEQLYLDCSHNRVWILYSVLDATKSDELITQWTRKTAGLDRCWLTRHHLLHYKKNHSWSEKGIGLKFKDGLKTEEEAGRFSLKAWYRGTGKLKGLDELLESAKENFAITSTRWQKRSEFGSSLTAEWYSTGKVTINRALDIDEVFLSITEMANRYEDSLNEATKMRDKLMGAFELDFSQPIDLEAFSATVSKGKGMMNLWLIETEKEPDFRRFRGVDLHTWDRMFIDIGPDYAHLTIPGKGCVNAAPRLATIQGEDNAGKVGIFFDGVELFA